jgi:hypothetical protein
VRQFYAERTDPNGPAMTWSMHCIGTRVLARPLASGLIHCTSVASSHLSSAGWLDVFDSDRAHAMLHKSAENMLAPFGVWTETPISAGEGGAQGFITAAGGFLQSLLFGYGGFRLQRNSATMRPSLPPRVTKARRMRACQWLSRPRVNR